MQELWQTGEPAVPLLIAAIERHGPAALPAMQVLALLGHPAKSALPALRKIAAAGELGLRGPAAFTIAQIGERESVLVPAYMRDQIVEIDVDGKELRTLTVESPWCVVPLADEHVLVASYSQAKVIELAQSMSPQLTSIGLIPKIVCDNPEIILRTRRYGDACHIASHTRSTCVRRGRSRHAFGAVVEHAARFPVLLPAGEGADTGVGR